jgi:serine/threonine protein kinase
MPAPTTTPELLEVVRKSGLIEPARLDAYLVTHPGPYETPAELCDRLQADGLITPFHARQLVRGKHRGFFLGKHKVLDRIGLGGMGQVFLAEHVTMKRRVAIKVLPPDRAENKFARERFLREARAAGLLDHPNLVRAFDVDADGDIIFLVMEFVDGISFHDLVSRFGPLDPARAGYYLWQAANGLAYLHAHGLIHRDIKPANLLVDRLGVVKILDLGLVRSEAEDDNLTRGEGVKFLGTADYLAPEQAIDCSNVDARADLYSLGAMGYFLLTGQTPFDGDRVAQKLIAHQTKAIRPIRELRPEVPAALCGVITKLLAKKPADRYQNAAELLAALSEWAQTPPPPPTEEEIPAVTGSAFLNSASVSFSAVLLRSAERSGGSSVTLGGSASGSSSGRLNGLASSAARAGASSSVLPKPAEFLPPILPASATHGERAPAAPLPELAATAPPPVSRSRQRFSVAIAFSLALAIAVWQVALLAGASFQSSPRQAPANPPADTTPDGNAAARAN